ncbi:hypothetical protein MKW98_030246, partial [Papaver atlanticum]
LERPLLREPIEDCRLGAIYEQWRWMFQHYCYGIWWFFGLWLAVYWWYCWRWFAVGIGGGS